MATGRESLVKKLSGQDTSGGEAYQRWHKDPGENWRPPSKNGASQAFPIPPANKKNKYWRGKPKPIPLSGPSTRGLTQGLPRQV